MSRGVRTIMLLAGVVAALASVGAFGPARAAHPLPADATGLCEELVVNGGFENGYAGWSHYSRHGLELVDTFNPHSGYNSAWLGIRNEAEDWMAQILELPADGRDLKLSYWWSIITEEAPGITDDAARVELLRQDGTSLAAIQELTNESGEQYVYYRTLADLSAYAGQTLQLRLYAKTDKVAPSHFYFDDVSVLACGDETTATSTPTASATGAPAFTPAARRFLPLVLR